MKRLLVLAVALGLAGYVSGQEPSAINKADYAAPKSGGALTVPLGYLTIRDEVTDRTNRSVLTFLGAGVTCADSIPNLATECTIPGSSGAVATDVIWDAAGDLVVGTGADTAGRLAKGADGKVLTMTAGAVGWASLPAAAGSVLLQASSPGTPDVGNWNITGVGTSTHDNIHATLTPGLFLSNTQAALVGQQQEYSPSLKFVGAGWNIGGAASETNAWQVFARPIAGTPSSVDLVFEASLAGAAYTQQAYLQSNGHLTLGNSGTTNGALSFLNDTSGSILLTPPAGQALGGKTITLPVATGTMALLENPSFTLFSVGNGSTGPGYFDVLEDSDNGSNYIRVIGQSTLAANRTYTLPDVGSDGTVMIAPTAYPRCTNPLTCAGTFEDFFGRGPNQGGTTPASIGSLYVLGAGTVSGESGTGALAADGAHPGVFFATTGTASTGTYFVGAGHLQNSSSDSIAATTGTIVECDVWIDRVSDGSNTHKERCGLMDLITASGQDELAIYIDAAAGGSAVNWGCSAREGGSSVTTLSNVAATYGAWHKLRVAVNSANASVGYFVDGTELSCSPITDAAKIPSGATSGMAAGFSSTASLGCSSATWANAASCSAALDYIYFYNPLLTSR